MKSRSGYKVIPLTFNRMMAGISAAIAKEKSTIHGITEVDITQPRAILKNHKVRTGESLSLTAYVICCLARTVAENPTINSFRKRGKIIMLEDVSVSVLVEREIEGEKIPEPMGIREAQKKTFLQIHNEIRAAQQQQKEQLGSLSNAEWVRLIPGFLMRTFFRIASKNIWMQQRYGVISVTAVGMFSKEAAWFIPLGGATVLVTVGSISNKLLLIDGKFENREHLCLTVSFDHEIVDGAPAARFVSRLAELIKSGHLLHDEIAGDIENNTK